MLLDDLTPESRRVSLVSVTPAWYDWIFETVATGPNLRRWIYGGRTPSPESFVSDLWKGVSSQFVVTRASDGAPVALTQFYGSSPESRSGSFSLVSGADAAPMLAVEGALLHFDHIFRSFDLLNLYIEYPEYNETQFETFVGRYCFSAGRYPDHFFADGRRWARVVSGLSRETYECRLQPLVERCRALAP